MSELREDFALPGGLGVRARTTARPTHLRSAPTGWDRTSGRPWRKRYRALLAGTDTVLITATVLGTGWMAGSAAGSPPTDPVRYFSASLFVCAVWTAAMCLFHTRDTRLIGAGGLEYRKVLQACAGTIGLLAVIALLLGADVSDPYLLLTFPCGALLLIGGRRGCRQWLDRQRRFGHYLSRVIVLGRQDDVKYVVRQIGKMSGAAYDVVGAVVEGTAGTGNLQVGQRRVPVVASTDTVPAGVSRTGADTVIVAGHLGRGSSYVRELGWKLEESSTELVLASSLTNVASERIQVQPFDGLPLVHVEPPQFTGTRHMIKRAFDVVASAAALVILAPLLLVLALLIRHDSPGKAFFCQERVGRNGETFCMYKFRSMVETAEDELAQLAGRNEGAGPLFKLRNDPRITRVGAWMRRYSLDELPQFINVLKGDMSLVGPRPPLRAEVDDYQEHVHRRLLIKPGVTGLWQVSGRSDLDWEESVRLDLYYVENWSFGRDLAIMWRTLEVMLKPEGAY